MDEDSRLLLSSPAAMGTPAAFVSPAVVPEPDLPEYELELAQEQNIGTTAAPPFAGSFSAALSLIYVGVLLIMTLYNPAFMQTALRSSPVILVFLGAEIALNLILTRGKHQLHISPGAWFCTALIITLTFLLSALSIGFTTEIIPREWADSRIVNQLTASIAADVEPVANIADIDLSLELYRPPESYSGIYDIADDDYVGVTFIIASEQLSARSFVKTARQTLSILANRANHFNEITFVSDSGMNKMRLEVNGRVGMNLTEEQLLHIMTYFLSEADEDLVDLK